MLPMHFDQFSGCYCELYCEGTKMWEDFIVDPYYQVLPCLMISLINFVGIKVVFSEDKFTGSEFLQYVLVNIELIGGVSTKPFIVTVIQSDQSPVSAQGTYIST